jgi:transposase
MYKKLRTGIMLKTKEPEDKLYYCLNIDALVPEDHLLKYIDKNIQFDFIRSRVKHLYSHTGRPSVDPVVLFKMLLIGYLYDIKSERQLEQDIRVNLAYRWFIKYDIDESIPDHSTISQTRRRKFLESKIFQEIFDEIVRQCIAKGFIKGETILTDSTHIKANASYESLKEISITPVEFIKRLDENLDENIDKNNNTDEMGDNKTEERNIRYSNDTHISCSDPDSKLMNRKGKPKGLHYLEHRSIDMSGYITDVHVTPGNLQDSEVYIDRLNRQFWAFKFSIRNVVADKGYGTAEIYKILTDEKINAYIPQRHKDKVREGMFTRKDFIYDSENDNFKCPAGHELERRSAKVRDDGDYVYAGSRSFCNNFCSKRKQCTTTGDKLTKQIRRHQFQDYIDIQLEKKNSIDWNKMLRKRKTIMEGSFANAKNNHGLRRAKMRGLKKVQEQSHMTAIAQNIKKMVKDMRRFVDISEKKFKNVTNIIFNWGLLFEWV